MHLFSTILLVSITHQINCTIIEACETGNVALVKLLIGEGHGVESRSLRGWTPLMCASQIGHTEIARLLIEEGHAIVDSTDVDGNTKCLLSFSLI